MTAKPRSPSSRPRPGSAPPGRKRLTWAALLCSCVLAACGGGEQSAGNAKDSGYAVPSRPADASTTSGARATPPSAAAHRAAWSAVDSRDSTPSQQAGDLAQDPAQGLRGLPNPDNDCFVNATLQLLTHLPGLREVALANLQNAQMAPQHAALQEFLAAYESGSAEQLHDRHHALLVQLRQLPGFPAADEPGSLLDLWANAPDSPTPGLDLPSATVVDLNQMQNLYAQQHRVFSMGVHQVGQVQTNGPVDYQWLPHPEQLVAMVYNTGGHYIAFLRQHDQWWRLSDAQVQAIDLPQLQGLPIGAGQGFELVIYADEPMGPLIDGSQNVASALRRPEMRQIPSAGKDPGSEPDTSIRFLKQKTRRAETHEEGPARQRQSSVDPQAFAHVDLRPVSRQLRFDGSDFQRSNQHATPLQQGIGIPEAGFGPSSFLMHPPEEEAERLQAILRRLDASPSFGRFIHLIDWHAGESTADTSVDGSDHGSTPDRS